MKKILFGAAIASMMLASCGSEPSYQINGTTTEDIPEGSTVYLRNVNGELLDSALVQNNVFQFSGRQDEPIMRYVSYMVNNRAKKNVFMILENGAIQVQMSKEGLDASGTENNNAFYACKKQADEVGKKVVRLMRETRKENVTAEELKQLKEQIEQVKEERKNVMAQALATHITTPVGAALVMNNFTEPFPAEEQMKWMQQIPQEYRNERIEKKMNYAKALLASAVGQKFVDFTMKDMDGKDVKLADIVAKNRLTLVDFWASWCGPCRGEMPNVVKAYKNYHMKGLEIVGVSLDDKADRWKNAVEQLGMTWIQLSDLKSWSCEGAQLYAVRGIPATVLINQEGTIVARDLRGDALDAKLEELLK